MLHPVGSSPAELAVEEQEKVSLLEGNMHPGRCDHHGWRMVWS